MRWVTVHWYTISVCNQPLSPTQPPTTSGTGNEYQPRKVAVLFDEEGSHRLCVALALHRRLCVYLPAGSVVYERDMSILQTPLVVYGILQLCLFYWITGLEMMQCTFHWESVDKEG